MIKFVTDTAGIGNYIICKKKTEKTISSRGKTEEIAKSMRKYTKRAKMR